MFNPLGCHSARNMIRIEELPCPKCGQNMELFIRGECLPWKGAVTSAEISLLPERLQRRSNMRLANIQNFLRRHGVSFRYLEENGCGSIEFLHRGLNYYIWEYPASEPGAQSNVRCAGRPEDFGENYEDAILAILQSW